MRFLIILIKLICLCGAAYAQRPLTVSTDKTVALIFPYPIKYVDRGTKDVIVQPVKENEKLLLVKAASKDFTETNLSVVTNDGHVYSFMVNYALKPDSLLIELPEFRSASIETYARSIADNHAVMKNIRDKTWSIEASVTGIYIKEKVIYLQLFLCNHSAINYDIDVLRFFIRDQKKGKRTAAQENECVPLYIAGNTRQINAYNFSVIVVALNKFTIPDAKFFGIQVMEKNGGRHLQLKIDNAKLLKALVLPDLF
jgi:conjugative transposon TraN protein